MKKGTKVKIKRHSKLYKHEDSRADVAGAVAAGELATVIMGPHMGQHCIKTVNGVTGWISNGDIEPVSG